MVSEQIGNETSVLNERIFIEINCTFLVITVVVTDSKASFRGLSKFMFHMKCLNLVGNEFHLIHNKGENSLIFEVSNDQNIE